MSPQGTHAPLMLLAWLWWAQIRHQSGRLLLAVIAIAIGVALALGIHLVNRSALAEFASSIAQVNGEAQAQLIGRSGTFGEDLIERVSSIPGVAIASPVIDVRARIMHSPGRPSPHNGQTQASYLRVVGIDPFRAAAVTPGLIPQVSDSGPALASALFDPDAIFLSRAALLQNGLGLGDTVSLRVGDQLVHLVVRGTVDGSGSQQALAVMDIGTLQWRIGPMGRISRIDLLFDGERDLASLRRAVEAQLPAAVIWSGPQADVQRMSNLSRAYRVNLNVLALVALFTGIFIVHSALALMVARQSGEHALLSVLGASGRLSVVRVTGSALMIGTLGAALGVACGIGLAQLMLQLTRGDLGGGYFSGIAPTLEIDALSVIVALTGGVLAALAGAWGPARSARRVHASASLRGAASEAILDRTGHPVLAALLAVLAMALLAAPPIDGLPIAAYAAIALLLVAGILLSPALLRRLCNLVAEGEGSARLGTMGWLALQRIAGSPGQTATAHAGVIASIALASAMAIMVTSFRTSVEQWLDQVLPADLYGRASSNETVAALSPAIQDLMSQAPGATRTRFTRLVPLLLDPKQPAVSLIARDFGAEDPARQLPMTGELRSAPPGAVRAWITEAVVDLHGYRPGDWIDLPIGPEGSSLRVFVAGVWRDYSRQFGAIAIDRDAYRRHTGDHSANEVAWWLNPGTDPAAFATALRAQSPAMASLELRDTLDLKSLSMRIFDRSFVVTYALEAIAIAVALFGAASSRAAEALARQREFGMMRHIGLTRRQLGWCFTIEGALGATLACVWGLALGAGVAAILVHHVNPQSFHWTMSMHWPVGLLIATVLTTVLLAALAARLVARQAMGPGPLEAVRADW